MALSPGFFESIGREFPVDFASIDPSDLATYGRDWTGAFPPRASILCRPHTTDEVSRLMKLCAQHRVPVVPSGGRTGLACGALATCGELILSLERMRGMEPVESLGRTVRVQAGAVIESVRLHCAEAGLFWPIDLHSTGSQIGGIIATNAGGMRVVRYGLTRHWVLGLTVVLANGDVLAAQRSPREKQRWRRSAAALHRQRRNPRHHHRSHAKTHSSSREGRCLAARSTVLRSGASSIRARPKRVVHPDGIRVFHGPLPRARDPPPPAPTSLRRSVQSLCAARGDARRGLNRRMAGVAARTRFGDRRQGCPEFAAGRGILDLPNGYRYVAKRCGFHPQAQRCAAAFAPSRLLRRTRDFARQQLF